MENNQNAGPMWQGLKVSYPLLRPSEVTELTGLSRATIYGMIRAGTFPPYIKLGRRASALPAAWLQKFLDQLSLIDTPASDSSVPNK